MATASSAPDRKNSEISEPAAFRLGQVHVYPISGKISGPDGTRQLDPKVMEVLIRLVAADGKVVSRETLMDAVWGGMVVTDFALSRCIYQLRKNLGLADGTGESPIETLSKRGYRLVWPVLEASKTPLYKPSSKWSLFPVAALVLLLGIMLATWFFVQPDAVEPLRPAIAVLPFKDLTKSGDLDYFGDGIATALRIELGHLPGLDVIAESSSNYFRDRQASAAEIGLALNSAFLLEGSVNRKGDAVQVTAALIDAADSTQIWSRSFMGVTGQAFTAEQEIAADIAGYLDVSLGDARRHGGTTNFEALEAYLHAIHSEDPDMIDFYTDQALIHDPDYAHALVAKAYAIYLKLWQGDGAPEIAWGQARPFLQRALAITDELPTAHVLIAGFQILREDYAAAESELHRALEINPSDSWAFVHLSRLMERTGHLEEAVSLAERNVRLDPMNPFRHIQLANRRWTAEDFEGGRASFERALELDPLNYAAWRDYALRLSNRDGEIAGFRLIARLQKNHEFRSLFTGSNPELAPSGVEIIALWLGFMGDYERELEMLELQSRLGESGNLHRELAWSLLAQGDLENAQKEAWIGLEGMPREPIVNMEVATLALMSENDLDRVLDHYSEYWPGLFEYPPELTAAPEKVAIAAALVMRARNHDEQANQVLESLLENEITPDSRAMALAHLGNIDAALEALDEHVNKRGYFNYFPDDPFWEPLSTEPGFIAIVEAEATKDALARTELNGMLDSGELILPGQPDTF